MDALIIVYCDNINNILVNNLVYHAKTNTLRCNITLLEEKKIIA